jgi:hypothetical protein
MAVYQLIDRLTCDPETSDKWVIERAVPGGPPIRLQFRGTRREALAETKRLNGFLKIKTNVAAPTMSRAEPARGLNLLHTD